MVSRKTMNTIETEYLESNTDQTFKQIKMLDECKSWFSFWRSYCPVACDFKYLMLFGNKFQNFVCSIAQVKKKTFDYLNLLII